MIAPLVSLFDMVSNYQNISLGPFGNNIETNALKLKIRNFLSYYFREKRRNPVSPGMLRIPSRSHVRLKKQDFYYKLS